MAPIVPPTEAIDWAQLKFALVPTNGYAKTVWSNGSWSTVTFVPGSDIALPVSSVSLNYGQSVFEGCKAFRHSDGQVRVFRPQMNSKRINVSGASVMMPSVPEELFLEVIRTAVGNNLEFVPPYSKNGANGSMYIRPLLFGSGGNLILASPTTFTFLVWVTPTGSLYGDGTITPAVDSFVIGSFDRAAPKGTGSYKLAGNYAPTFIHATAAKKAGYAITLHLDSLTHSNIDEFSTSNFLAISSPAASPLTTLVVPTSPSILKSITTESIIEIAQSKGWIVERRIVPFAEVINGGFSEVAACGTAAAITPIKSITYHTDPQQTLTKLSIGNGETPGAIFLEILNELTGVQCGDMKDTRGWVWPAEGISLID